MSLHVLAYITYLLSLPYFSAPLNELNSNSYLLNGGTSIPNNANMDDYKTPGNYYCENYTTANTIKNNPFPNTPFILKVEFNTGQNYPIQTFTKFEGKVIAKRMLSISNNVWTNWVYFSDDATVLKSNFEISTTESYAGDCNGITEPGLFNRVINPDAVNGPGQYAYIVVYSASHFDMITQIALPYNINGTLKVRTREAGTWRDWRTP